ncbi:MAG: hypothetical protein CVV27_10800 [Candidatus Melainabacteria bacterium HGW-Melainabacteria-1]|nr:MAG: hypothetical protein CVV27_10800 [Candidatus Melainabacteria bacterium HGW-Melainabacteria-1]
MLSQQVYQRKGFSRLNLLLLLGLLCFSCLGVWSTTSAAGGSGQFLRHLLSILVGLGVFFAVALTGYRTLQRWSPGLYLLLLLLLGLVLLIGPYVAGSRRWIYLGGFSFQPSEFAKLVLSLSLSAHLAGIRRLTPLQVLLLALHIGLPCLLILREPDLGMTLVLCGLFFSMLVVSPASPWILSLCLAPALSVLLYFVNQLAWQAHLMVGALGLSGWALWRRWQRQPVLVVTLFGAGLLLFNASVIMLGEWGWQHLHPYQRQRIVTFLNPDPDTLSSGYQVMQSTIAVGAGGLTGQGLNQGSQTQLRLVPEQHTDFIFSAIAEEGGFLGAGLLLLLFSILVFRILWIGFQAREPSQLYICAGVAALMLMQLLINVGMNMDLMPVKGVPLPLISYGGTSMIIQLGLLGLVESIYLSQHDPSLMTEWE